MLEDVIVFDRPEPSLPTVTGRYRDAIPMLLRSVGAMEGVYPTSGPIPFMPEGA